MKTYENGLSVRVEAEAGHLNAVLRSGVPNYSLEKFRFGRRVRASGCDGLPVPHVP